MDNIKEVALITGGSRGIGRAIAARLLKEGKQVVITGRNAATLENCRQSLSEEVLVIEADASSLSDARRVVENTIDAFGQIDILVNNAGVTGDAGPSWTIDPDIWWKTQEVNLRGVFNHMHFALPHMVKRKSGAIFNVGSYVGIRPSPNVSAYTVSKAGVARLSDSIAAEVADYGINVFCISPGLVETDMTRDIPFFKDLPASAWNPPDKLGQMIVNILGRDCSALSGRFFHADDDLDAMLEQADKVKSKGLYQLGLYSLDGRIV